MNLEEMIIIAELLANMTALEEVNREDGLMPRFKVILRRHFTVLGWRSLFLWISKTSGQIVNIFL